MGSPTTYGAIVELALHRMEIALCVLRILIHLGVAIWLAFWGKGMKESFSPLHLHEERCGVASCL